MNNHFQESYNMIAQMCNNNIMTENERFDSCQFQLPNINYSTARFDIDFFPKKNCNLDQIQNNCFQNTINDNNYSQPSTAFNSEELTRIFHQDTQIQNYQNYQNYVNFFSHLNFLNSINGLNTPTFIKNEEPDPAANLYNKPNINTPEYNVLRKIALTNFYNENQLLYLQNLMLLNNKNINN